MLLLLLLLLQMCGDVRCLGLATLRWRFSDALALRCLRRLLAALLPSGEDATAQVEQQPPAAGDDLAAAQLREGASPAAADVGMADVTACDDAEAAPEGAVANTAAVALGRELLQLLVHHSHFVRSLAPGAGGGVGQPSPLPPDVAALVPPLKSLTELVRPCSGVHRSAGEPCLVLLRRSSACPF